MRLKNLVLICSVLLILSQPIAAQKKNQLTRIHPPNWWVGMKHQELQILMQGQDIGGSTVSLEYPGVSIKSVQKAESPNYLFVDLLISDDVEPGIMEINLKNGNQVITQEYELKLRNTYHNSAPGINQSDVIYLLTPDRFVNGDPENDKIAGMLEAPDRSNRGGRHGGDLKGVQQKLDYLEDLGVTALWLNPIMQNDMPDYSYHGYAITDYYKTDARYGSFSEYQQLIDELHGRGMKIVMDMVFNHCGLEHWWMKDKPFQNWVHHPDQYVQTNHALGSISDPHASQSDRSRMETGWFVPTMPDLNHDNAFLRNYLIQNSIWWIEMVGLDGIRMDTYPYNRKDFMTEWGRRLFEQYPNFYMVGETWVANEAQEAYWGPKNPSDQSVYHSGVSSITDFPLQGAIHAAFKPNGDVRKLYDVLSKDFLYYNPDRNKIFADNHDMDRVFHVLEGDLEKYKMAMTFLLTTRGIPQLYYGTEILLRTHGDHGDIRQDFPGGWAGDSRNAFEENGRSTEENEAFNYVRKILQWRQKSNAIKSGDLIHFMPDNNVYVYARRSDDENVVVAINNSGKEISLDATRYDEVLRGFSGASDIISGKVFKDLSKITVPANSAIILAMEPEIKSNSTSFNE